MIQQLYNLFLKHPKISTDSRRIEPDGLFFALHGASFDGNRFAIDALRKGAAYAVVDDASLLEAHPAERERLFPVEDTLQALQALAHHHRRQLHIPVLAIAGSNGKTTTKELTAAVLACKYHTKATRGNLNNHIGVPLTLLEIGPEVEFAIVEMGASACSEIALLCSIAEPDYGLLTNIGRSHLEGFGGVEGIRRGKGELFDYLAAHGGKAFVPQQDATLKAMWQERSTEKPLYYDSLPTGEIISQLEGEYNRFNIAAAMAIGRYFGIGEKAMREAVAAYTPQNHRSQRMTTARNTLIVDCYNANPSSMAVAIDHFKREEEAYPRRVMILGDMLELGSWSHGEHTATLQQALASQAEIWLVGEHFAQAARGLDCLDRVRLFATQAALKEELQQLHGALILIKGSHSIGLERCVEHL